MSIISKALQADNIFDEKKKQSKVFLSRNLNEVILKKLNFGQVSINIINFGIFTTKIHQSNGKHIFHI